MSDTGRPVESGVSAAPLGPERAGADQSPPRCMVCGYVLLGLGKVARCPECWRDFDLANPSTYITHPPFMAWRFWFPGLCLAAITGIVTMAALIYAMGSWGWSVWIGAPLAAGCVLGYRVRAKWSVLPLLGLGLVVMMCFGLMSLSIAGVFCGLVFAGIALGPVLIGSVLGVTLRNILKSTGFDQRSYLPVLAIAAAALACGWLDRPPPVGLMIESVSTGRIINATPDRVWDSLMFYEEVRHAPPLILRIGLARPLSTKGSSRAPGDVKVCIYNKGHITKRITEARQPELLAFETIDQQIGYERDVRLVGGSFKVTPAGPGRTLVTLTTTYEPLLRPRLGWRWGERWGVHTLHDHVLEGMRLRAEAPMPTAAAVGAVWGVEGGR